MDRQQCSLHAALEQQHSPELLYNPASGADKHTNPNLHHCWLQVLKDSQQMSH